jgi:hypothetical protein
MQTVLASERPPLAHFGVQGSVAVGADQWGGTGLYAASDCKADCVISSIPLNRCLCVKDSGLAPVHHRGICEVDIEQVRLPYC